MADDQEKKVVVPVTTGVIKKKSLWDTFLTEDWSKIKQYVVSDVIMPNIKRSIDEIVSNTVHMILYKGEPPKRTPGVFGVESSRIQYGSFFGNGGPSRTPPTTNGKTANEKFNSSVYGYENIVIPTKGDAEAVLQTLEELISVYGKASVNDLYSAVGITGNYTDSNFGWVNLSTAYTQRAGGGYVLVMPKAKQLQ